MNVSTRKPRETMAKLPTKSAMAFAPVRSRPNDREVEFGGDMAGVERMSDPYS
jgi:hypothetical protein